jgi:xanthine dehydrogenase YagR molybdenum-binding subunit
MTATTYIGTATSRVDGRAKVTGTAKYAGEFNQPGLAHGSVVTSTIAKGCIAHIEVSEALAVEGVIDVLTHQNRPHMAHDDSAYKDDVAPEDSPYRPLYDDRILFSFRPVALVVAEEPEIARFAASLVRVEYEPEEHVTDLRGQRDSAFALEAPANPAEIQWRRRSRALMPSRLSPHPRCVTAANTLSRSSTTTRRSRMPRL